MDFDTPDGLTRKGDDDRRVEVIDFVGELRPTTFGGGEDLAGAVGFVGVFAAELVSTGSSAGRGLLGGKGEIVFLGVGVALGVVRTGVFFGVEDSARVAAFSSFGVRDSAALTQLSSSFLTVGTCIVASGLLEPLTLTFGGVLARSSATGSCTAGVAFTGSSLFWSSRSETFSVLLGASTVSGASTLNTCTAVESSGALTKGATFCCKELKFEVVPTEMKLDFTRGFPAIPFVEELSFLFACVLAVVLPCCSKKARKEETYASLARPLR